MGEQAQAQDALLVRPVTLVGHVNGEDHYEVVDSAPEPADALHPDLPPAPEERDDEHACHDAEEPSEVVGHGLEALGEVGDRRTDPDDAGLDNTGSHARDDSDGPVHRTGPPQRTALQHGAREVRERPEGPHVVRVLDQLRVLLLSLEEAHHGLERREGGGLYEGTLLQAVQLQIPRPAPLSEEALLRLLGVDPFYNWLGLGLRLHSALAFLESHDGSGFIGRTIEAARRRPTGLIDDGVHA